MIMHGPIANPGLVVHEEDDGALLFDPDTGKVDLLNPSAAWLFRLLDGKHSAADLVERLVLEFDLKDRAGAQRDVDEFLADLRRRGIVGDPE
jgi:PqqD family protein of HPr-rel-A system